MFLFDAAQRESRERERCDARRSAKYTPPIRVCRCTTRREEKKTSFDIQILYSDVVIYF